MYSEIFRKDGLAFDLSGGNLTVDYSFHPKWAVARDAANPWWRKKRHHHLKKAMEYERDWLKRHERPYTEYFETVLKTQPVATWSFLYERQITDLDELCRLIESDTRADILHQNDFDGWFEMEFSQSGVGLRRLMAVFVRGDSIVIMKRARSNASKATFFGEKHFGEEMELYSLPLGDRFPICDYGHTSTLGNDLYGDPIPFACAINVTVLRRFLSWTAGEVVQAALYVDPAAPPEPPSHHNSLVPRYCFSIRSLTTPIAWFPSVFRTAITDVYPTYPRDARQFKIERDRSAVPWQIRCQHLSRVTRYALS